MKYKAIIVDDEQFVIQDLQGLLVMHCPEVEVVATANQPSQVAKLVEKHTPQLLFVDIHLGELSGIDLVRRLRRDDLHVIFVTAHDHYAVEAFRLSAVDYLLKPVDAEELIDAVGRAKHTIDQEEVHQQLMALVANLSPDNKNKKIVLSDLEGLHIIDIKDILWCHANGSYTEFQLLDGSKLTVSKHLKTYEKMLSEREFMRVHRSYLVNIFLISKLERQRGEIRMKNGLSLPILPSAEIIKAITERLQS